MFPSGVLLTSPRTVQAVEKAAEMAFSAEPSQAHLYSVSSLLHFLRLPFFVVGAATEKIAEARFGALIEKLLSKISISASSSWPDEIPLPSLKFLGAESGNAKNLADFVVEYFSKEEKCNDGEFRNDGT